MRNEREFRFSQNRILTNKYNSDIFGKETDGQNISFLLVFVFFFNERARKLFQLQLVVRTRRVKHKL